MLMEVGGPQDLMGFQLWDLVVFRSCQMELVSSGPAQVLALGRCGVHFRLTGDGPPQDPLVFRLWDIVGLVQAEWVSF